MTPRRLVLAAALLLAPLAIGSAAKADSACDHTHNDFDGLYCLSKVYQQADHDLNTAFTQLKSKLDADGQKTLRSTQLQWLKARNDSCSRHEGTSFYINLQCATDTTEARTEFLQARIRECVSSGCMNSKL